MILFPPHPSLGCSKPCSSHVAIPGQLQDILAFVMHLESTFFLRSLSDSYIFFLSAYISYFKKDIDLLADIHFLCTCLYFDYIEFSFLNLLHCAGILVLS